MTQGKLCGQEEAENSKFNLEQRVQQLETEVAVANAAKPTTSTAAAQPSSIADGVSTETRAKLEAAERQLAQMQQQNERLSSDRCAGLAIIRTNVAKVL